MKSSLKLLTVLTMPHKKTIPQVKGDFLLGNLSQMIANPFHEASMGSDSIDYVDLLERDPVEQSF